MTADTTMIDMRAPSPKGDIAVAAHANGGNDGQSARAQFGASEKAVSVFRAAQRHSIRVRVLKLALPVLAVTVAAIFSWFTFLATPPAPVKLEINTGGENGKLVMTSPHLNGYTKDNRPYSMTAVKATQDQKKNGTIVLEGISAELPIGDNGRAMVKAKSGIYDNANGRLQLDKDFVVTTDNGLKAVLRSADINLKSGQITTNKPVRIQTGTTEIQAGQMQVKDKGAVLIFEKDVRMTIDGNTGASDSKS
ncbi:LPS export ABC transporter periplasmic protein LptC [Daeguia caeni]|uniref:LPS export ABC transporter periplasmic protein LptC n=1 Tax=Daeguia caeni TaxID=439612 RepID=A0ABV9H697_9HYPH